MTALRRRKEVRLLTKEDRTQVESLLSKSLVGPIGFTTTSEAQKWTPTDDFYPCLGAFVDGQLVSYMRCEWIESQDELEIKIGEKFDLKIEYPIGYLAKAATHPDFRNEGLNLILRYHQFRIFNYWAVNSVIGTMVEGSPRINSLRHLGYYFFSLKKPWDGVFRSERPVLFAILDGPEKIRSAIQKIEIERAETLAEFEVNFLLSDVPMCGRVSMEFPWHKIKKIG